MPGVPLAVNAADVATPDVLVVAVLIPPANVPLAPLAGAVKATITPLTGLLPESLTVTTNGGMLTRPKKRPPKEQRHDGEKPSCSG